MSNNIILDREADITTRIAVLQDEVQYLNTQLQPHDTGHIRTAIHVLQDRIRQLQNSADRLAPFSRA